MSIDGDCLMFSRRLFHSVGASAATDHAVSSPFKALFVSRRISKSILRFIWRQCRSTRTWVMWSYLRHLVMTRVTWFWHFWSWAIISLGMANIKLLQYSSLDAMVVFTNFSIVDRSRYLRILPMEYRLKFIDLHTLATSYLGLHNSKGLWWPITRSNILITNLDSNM